MAVGSSRSVVSVVMISFRYCVGKMFGLGSGADEVLEQAPSAAAAIASEPSVNLRIACSFVCPQPRLSVLRRCPSVRRRSALSLMKPSASFWS